MKNTTIISKEISLNLKSVHLQHLNLDNLDITSFSLNQTFINSRECPHCGSHNIHSKGNYKGRKRYKCLICGKTYNDLTNTPFSGIHNLDKFKLYLTYLLKGHSIRKSAIETEVSIPTSFDWRHRVLKAFKHLPSPKMKNVLEAKEIELPYSHKGQRTPLTNALRNSKISAIFICDRTGKLDSDAISSSIKEENPIFQRISEFSTSHTDLICYPNFLNTFESSRINIKHPTSHYSQPCLITSIIHLWNNWMIKFRGVASKYLNNYLHWFDFLDNISESREKIAKLINLLTTS